MRGEVAAPRGCSGKFRHMASTSGTKTKNTAVTARVPRLLESTALMQAASTALRQQGKSIGFVPTMGALHEGHLALVREARQRSDVVVVSIFVNPLQFGPGEDLARYPRTLEADRLKCRSEGVDLLFVPDLRGMYPAGFETRVVPGKLTRRWEGRARPKHFEGVATVCAKLFALVQPHFAIFGEKDYQQLQVVRRMVRDLHLPLEIVALPVLRDVDGLALSSRNVNLTGAARKRATCLYRAIMAAQDRVSEGETRARALTSAARKVLKDTPGFELDYCAVIDPETLEPITELRGHGRIVVAGAFGAGRRRVRLIDNGPLFPPAA